MREYCPAVFAPVHHVTIYFFVLIAFFFEQAVSLLCRDIRSTYIHIIFSEFMRGGWFLFILVPNQIC